MNPTMQDLIRQMDDLLRRAETCDYARGVLGEGLIDARRVLDRMQFLLDRQHYKWGPTQ